MSPFSKVTATAALLLSIVWPFTSLAQNEQKRPVVGLVLSGGGSLGLAQIGVLRYLEEQRIPVDVIAGTSIGGLLGGLYATGHNASDLEKIISRADWKDLLRTTPRYEDRSVAEKQDWNRITSVYSLPLRGGFELPGGINAGHALVLLISGETLAYWDVADFDDLPIPFRCVATDLVSGEAYILQDGRLVEALRATMAIPGIFTPVERDGRILVDGGLVNNVPTNVAKDMGADVTVAVTLRVAAPNIADLRSLGSVVRQTVNIAVRQNELQQAQLADIEVAVPLPNRSSMDFSDTQSIIDAGYQAASQNGAVLGRLALTAQQWEAYLENRRSRERTVPDQGPVVDVSSADPLTERNVASELARKTTSATSRRRMENALSGLLAAAGLPNAFYGWHSETGSAGYQVKIEGRPATEIVLSPSFFYQLSKGEPSRPAFRLGAAAIMKDAYKSRFLGAVEIGSSPGLFLEYYHPFDGSAYFIAPGFVLERAHVSQYAGESRSDETRTRISASVFFGVGTWRHLQLRMGGRAGLDRFSSPVTARGIEASDTGFFNPEVEAIINTQDSGRLPTRGSRINVAAGWSFREHSFPYLAMNFDHFQPLGKQVSVFGMGRTDTTMGRNVTYYDQFTAGGLTDLDAYRYQEIRGDTVLTAGGGALYRGANPNESYFRPIFGSWYQTASVDPWSGNSQFRQSGTVGVFTPTPLGLAGATVSFDLKGSVRFRLSLGSFWNRP